MQVFGLVGNPVGHSLSPPMHEAAYDDLGIDARYVTFEPAPGDLEAAVEGARALGIAGLNVTVPFKEDVLSVPGVTPDDAARRIGAANTLAFPEGTGGEGVGREGVGREGVGREGVGGEGTGGERIAAHNTDAAGVRRALAGAGVDLDGSEAVVVGAGGAGRAAVAALLDAGATVAVANRTVERAERLAADFEGEPAVHPLSAAEGLVAGADVLVNATTVGMEEDASPVPAGALHGDLAVLDAVYRPLETRLLREAAAAGARTVDGAKMLLYQGVEAFERWTGRSAPVEAMERALYDRL